MFFWSHPRCFGPLAKFQHNIKISIKTARVSRLSVSCDYGSIQENLEKSPDYTTCLFFKCLQNSAKYTGWKDYRLCCTAIVLTLHRWNVLMYLNNYLFFYCFRKILRHILLVFSFEKMERMNRKNNHEDNSFLFSDGHDKQNILVRVSVNCFIREWFKFVKWI